MKGLSETMFIIIAVIVILIVALVVLTIFARIPGQIGSIAEATQNCRILADTSCRSAGTLPINWNFPSQNVGPDQPLLPCAGLLSSCRCDNGVPTGC